MNTITINKYRASNVQTALPQFGERLAGQIYTYRPGAYAVVFDADQRIAVVKNRDGYYYLLGGGIEPNETMEEALHREVLEESGYGHFYAASFGQRLRQPVDDHHVLVWLTAEEAMKQLCRESQAWAVRQAIECNNEIRM